MINKDPYLKLEYFGGDYISAPYELLFYNKMIKKKIDWENLGFKVIKETNNLNSYRRIKRGNYWFTFYPYYNYQIENDSQILEAINNQVKYVYIPFDVYIARRTGFTYEQMINVNEDVKNYAEAYLEYDKKQYNQALIFINKALLIKPDENCYVWLYFDIKLCLKDINGINEILKYFENDIDCFIYPGNMYKWIRLLIQKKQFEKTTSVISNINILFDDLISEKRQHKIYTPYKPEDYRCSKEKFNEKLTKVIEKMNLLTNKSKNYDVTL